MYEVGGQAVLGRQSAYATPWLTERHGYDPTSSISKKLSGLYGYNHHALYLLQRIWNEYFYEN